MAADHFWFHITQWPCHCKITSYPQGIFGFLFGQPQGLFLVTDIFWGLLSEKGGWVNLKVFHVLLIISVFWRGDVGGYLATTHMTPPHSFLSPSSCNKLHTSGFSNKNSATWLRIWGISRCNDLVKYFLFSSRWLRCMQGLLYYFITMNVVSKK